MAVFPSISNSLTSSSGSAKAHLVFTGTPEDGTGLVGNLKTCRRSIGARLAQDGYTNKVHICCTVIWFLPKMKLIFIFISNLLFFFWFSRDNSSVYYT